MNYEILIPSCKGNVDDILEKIQGFEDCNIITFCKDQSAAKNRNCCFNMSSAEIIIYCDDDLENFYQGWVTDLIKPLENNKIGIISARLLKQDGSKGVMQDYGIMLPFSPEIVKRKLVPSACIAMRRDDLLKIAECKDYEFNIPWDENYKRAGYEDSDLCEVYKKYLDKHICVNNTCKIVHRDEEKWRPGFDWRVNRNYFNNKWGF